MSTSTSKVTQAANEVALAKVAEVDAEIAALDKVILEAQGKRDDLIAVRQALTPLISSKQLPLGPPDLRVNGQMFPLADGRQSGIKLSNGQPIESATNTPAPNTNTGFRNAVRGALRDAAPKGLKPAELIKVLTERGDLARYSGKSKPQDRVYSELHSLRSSKEISKRYGRYVIHPGEATNAVT
jgi:hypothetical protein